MAPEELASAVRRRPFVPFRLILTEAAPTRSGIPICACPAGARQYSG
jgi:hypothetical protein